MNQIADLTITMQLLLSVRKKHNLSTDITVSGISMEPFLRNLDTVTIQPCSLYRPGDILVYPYKGELLIHRLITVKNGKLYCKGDNAFRMEDILPDKVFGKVTAAQRNDLAVSFMPDNLEEFLRLSLEVNHLFHKSGYGVERTKKSAIYQLYCNERDKNHVKEK